MSSHLLSETDQGQSEFDKYSPEVVKPKYKLVATEIGEHDLANRQND